MAGGHAKPSGARRLQQLAQPPPNGRVAAAPERGQGRLAEVARGGTLNLAGAALAAISSIGITVLVTRHFSKPVAGAFFTATSLFLIIEAASSLGGYVGLVNFIAGLRSLGQESRIPTILRAAVVPVVVASVVAAAALVLTAGPLANLVLSGHLAHAGADPATLAAALRTLALALPFAALSDTFLGASRGYRDMRPTVMIDRIGRSGLQCLGILVAVTAGSVSLLAPLWAVSYIPAAVIAWLWFRRIRRNAELRPANGRSNGSSGPARVRANLARSRNPGRTNLASKALARPDAVGFWRFTAPRAVAILAQTTIQRIDIVLVAIIRGPAEAAIYTAATRFLVAGQFGNTAISMAAQPRFAELFATGDRRGANVVYQTTTGWLVLLTWPMYLLAVLFGPEVLTVFGHSYRAGGTVMVILGCAMLVSTACGQVDMVLITTGRSGWSLANGLAAVGVNVTLDLLLIPRYGITGAAIGWAAAIGVTNMAALIQLALSEKVQPFGRGTLVAFGLTGISFFIIPFAGRALAGGTAVISVISVAVGCAVALAGLWRFRSILELSAMPGLSFIGRVTPDSSRTGPVRSR